MENSKTIKLEIVTFERVAWRGEVLQATLPTTSGEITILPDHLPLVSVINPGVIEVKTADGQTEILSIGGGFVEEEKLLHLRLGAQIPGLFHFPEFSFAKNLPMYVRLFYKHGGLHDNRCFL